MMGRLHKIAALVAACMAGGALAGNGNGNGAHVGPGGFLLNVNAFDQCPGGEFLDSNRHQIAVQASYTGNGTDKTAKVNKIFLIPGDDFWVQDGNACDNGAYFYLPITDANCSNCGAETLEEPTFTEYEVRARVLGKPGGTVTVTSCVEEAADDTIIVDDNTDQETLCSVGEGNIWVATRTVGNGKEQNRWENVSKQLLTVCVDTDDNLACDDRLGLFDPAGEGYWWNWDTQGRPHVQLVFYPVKSGL
jgi:hypothetical protein